MHVRCSNTTGARSRATSIHNNSGVLQANNMGYSDEGLGKEAGVLSEVKSRGRIDPNMFDTMISMEAAS